MPKSQLIKDIVTEKTSIEQALNELYILACDIDDKGIMEWATNELNGYSNDQELPSYRVVMSAHFTYSGINSRFQVKNVAFPIEWIPKDSLEECCTFKERENICSIIQHSMEKGGMMIDHSYLAGHVNKASGGMVACTSIYQHIPQAFFSGIQQTVKTKIIQILMEMEKKYGALDSLEVERMLDKKKVFIVHGRDTDTRDQVELFLHHIGLTPIILANEPNKGRSIIDKFEDYSDVSFAIVLYTGCDEGRLKGEPALRDRARQNVIFEHGYFCAKLTRANVVALHEPGVEVPSDLAGVLYISLDSDWKAELKKEMAAAGLEADWSKY